MENTILPGDMVFSEKVTYYTRSVQSGEVVTFVSTLESTADDQPMTLIKRVIAVGGQTVDIINGAVYVDGELLAEDYALGRTDPIPIHASGVEVSYPYTVPDGYIWVMGDNRELSKDSRYFGAVPVSAVTGRAFFIYWPLDRIGLLAG